ncbi:MAG: FAD-dependent oxidoreductase [Sphaerochaetaceae bacterium]|nr:FAD-dependent oxidoreductase [Sphaerochaetaceae bacterium]MDD3163429.1 FAD-dependent oxidoreductase [Sphaerochaetaceae bacterium]MDD4007637.1 FAD-dependent oxidoreductase [Sphaerochaetaceae bacterium]MDD4396585.1 FAD-dependent oxidoreductase [Sphaerochaetaceae bacterium]
MNLSALNRKLDAISPGIHAFIDDGAVHIEGQCSSYDDVVRCGILAARLHSRGVVNDCTCADVKEEPMRLPETQDLSLDGRSFDVVVIGAGVVGCAIAMELSHRNLSVAVLEKEYDVAVRASSRNDGMIHPGIDLHPGQRKTYFNCRGNRMYTDLSQRLGFKFIRNGSYVVFDRWWNLLTVPFFHLRAAMCHVDGVRYVTHRKLGRLQTSVASWQKGAMFLPSSGIVEPYQATVAFAENAADNKASFFFDTAVLDLICTDGLVSQVITNRGTIHALSVVNAAGVYSDRIAALANDRFFTIHPRKGTEMILDKDAGSITESVIAKVPFSDVKQHTKGGGVVRTASGNILVGPDAHETIQREDDSTSSQSITDILAKHKATVPSLDKRQIITYFSGTRACTYEEDFVVERSTKAGNLVHAAGIQSPGLTAAPAIAVEVASDIDNIFSDIYKRSIKVRSDAILTRKAPHVVSEMPLEQRDELIRSNPDYGQIVCRCEQVSRGEIIEVLRSSLPVYNIDAVKRRCRCGMGRCQGSFCSPSVAGIIAEEAHCSFESVCKGLGVFVKGKVKETSR